MNNRKEFHQKAWSTREKEVYIGYTAFWEEDSTKLHNLNDLSAYKVHHYISHKMRKTGGRLESFGEAITSHDLAREMGMTVREIGKALRDLVKLKILLKDEKGFHYHARMEIMYKNSETYRNETSDLQKFDERDSENETSADIDLDKTKISVASNLGQSTSTNQDNGQALESSRPGALLHAALTECFSIAGVRIAPEVTPQVVADIAAKFPNVTNVALSFRTLCARNAADPDSKPITINGLDRWFERERPLKTKTTKTSAAVKTQTQSKFKGGVTIE